MRAVTDGLGAIDIMRDRIIFGAIGAVLLIVLLLSETVIINIAVAIISFMTLFEVYRALNFTKHASLSFIGLAVSFGFTYVLAQNTKVFFALLFAYIVALFLAYMLRPEHITLGDISKIFFVTLYICLMFSTVVILRRMPYGEYYIWMVFIAAYVTDTFAYFTGKLFGKRRPFKKLSPNKTVEGIVGGVLFCTAAFIGYAFMLQNMGMAVNFLNIVVISLISSAMGIFGDLAASRIKREYGLKDFSGLIPGHGGIMDRFDSVLFTAPAIYILVNVMPVII